MSSGQHDEYGFHLFRRSTASEPHKLIGEDNLATQQRRARHQKVRRARPVDSPQWLSPRLLPHLIAQLLLHARAKLAKRQ